MRNTAQSRIFRSAASGTEHLECSECQFKKSMSGAVYYAVAGTLVEKGQSSYMCDVSSLTPACFTAHVVHCSCCSLFMLFVVQQFTCAKQSKCVDIHFRCEPNLRLTMLFLYMHSRSL